MIRSRIMSKKWDIDDQMGIQDKGGQLRPMTESSKGWMKTGNYGATLKARYFSGNNLRIKQHKL